LTTWAVAAQTLAAAAALGSEHLPGDPTAGAGLAKSWCGACHEVEPGIRGPGVFGAPAFQDVADDPAATELALRVFLRTPHSEMPNEQLSPDQTDDVISYILELGRSR
jgi:mono/diheme cytochrome c family protein